MTKKIMVTGGAGYIGSHVVKQLTEAGYSVVVYDNLSTGYKQAVKNAELIVGDLEDLDKLNATLDKYQFDAVMHFAGSIIVPESVQKPDMYYLNNTVNSLNLANACVKNNVNNLVFSSTAAVYGILDEDSAVETSLTNPINPYGHSKLMTEQMLKDIEFANDQFNFVALRYFNVSGADPDGQIGQAFPGATHLIKVNCEAAVGKREKTYIFGTDFETPDGSGVRDYIHVCDLASAHLKALEYLFAGNKSDIFNCGYGRGFSVKEVVQAVKDISGVDYKVEIAGRREGDPASLISKVDKIKNVLKWKPQHDDINFIIKTAFDWERSDTLTVWKKEKL